MIRVGAGNARGRILKAPKGERPTLGRIKQPLFDILAPRLPDSCFLDLFAGSGAVGIEALSQGAAEAVFVEAKAAHARLIRENLAVCGFGERAQVICTRAEIAIGRLSRQGKRFHFAFLDPPYRAREDLAMALKACAREDGIMLPDGIIIVQRSRREPPPPVPAGWERFDSRRIGESLLEFFRKEPS